MPKHLGKVQIQEPGFAVGGGHLVVRRIPRSGGRFRLPGRRAVMPPWLGRRRMRLALLARTAPHGLRIVGPRVFLFGPGGRPGFVRMRLAGLGHRGGPRRRMLAFPAVEQGFDALNETHGRGPYHVPAAPGDSKKSPPDRWGESPDLIGIRWEPVACFPGLPVERTCRPQTNTSSRFAWCWVGELGPCRVRQGRNRLASPSKNRALFRHSEYTVIGHAWQARRPTGNAGETTGGRPPPPVRRNPLRRKDAALSAPGRPCPPAPPRPAKTARRSAPPAAGCRPVSGCAR